MYAKLISLYLFPIKNCGKMTIIFCITLLISTIFRVWTWSVDNPEVMHRVIPTLFSQLSTGLSTQTSIGAMGIKNATLGA